MFDVRQEIFQWYVVLQEILVANGTESNGLNLFSRIRGTVEQGLGLLLISSGTVVLISSMKLILSSSSLTLKDYGVMRMKRKVPAYTKLRSATRQRNSCAIQIFLFRSTSPTSCIIAK